MTFGIGAFSQLPFSSLPVVTETVDDSEQFPQLLDIPEVVEESGLDLAESTTVDLVDAPEQFSVALDLGEGIDESGIDLTEATVIDVAATVTDDSEQFPQVSDTVDEVITATESQDALVEDLALAEEQFPQALDDGQTTDELGIDLAEATSDALALGEELFDPATDGSELASELDIGQDTAQQIEDDFLDSLVTEELVTEANYETLEESALTEDAIAAAAVIDDLISDDFIPEAATDGYFETLLDDAIIIPLTSELIESILAVFEVEDQLGIDLTEGSLEEFVELLITIPPVTATWTEESGITGNWTEDAGITDTWVEEAGVSNTYSLDPAIASNWTEEANVANTWSDS